MTKQQTIDAIRGLGMVGRWSADWQEWTVNFPIGDARRTADSDYRTNEADDALVTARAMASQPSPAALVHCGHCGRFNPDQACCQTATIPAAEPPIVVRVHVRPAGLETIVTYWIRPEFSPNDMDHATRFESPEAAASFVAGLQLAAVVRVQYFRCSRRPAAVTFYRTIANVLCASCIGTRTTAVLAVLRAGQSMTCANCGNHRSE